MDNNDYPPRNKQDTNKPVIIFSLALLTATGGGQYAATQMALRLVELGYTAIAFSDTALNKEHKYYRLLTEVGIPVHYLPHMNEFVISRWMKVLAQILLTLPYALFRLRSLRYSWQATAEIFSTWVARFEHRHIERLIEQYTAHRQAILHVWGPTGRTPYWLKLGKDKAIPVIYHEMGEADKTYVKTWRLEPTVAIINAATRVICCSPIVEENIRGVYGYKGEITCIPFMTEPPPEDWQMPERQSSRLMLGVIGRLVEHKGHRYVLEAVRALIDRGYDVGAVIAGEGVMRKQLEDLTERLNIQDRVVFTGTFERLEDVMAMFDIFVICSWSESQCMPITESMAYGKPVIVSNFGGMPDFVEEGRSGFLIAPGNATELVEAVEMLVNDPSLVKAMGARGREIYFSSCSPEIIMQNFIAVYDQLLANFEVRQFSNA